MVRDVAFEAAVLRGGLLLGLVHEREVPEWAMAALGISESFDAALADVCLAPVELSAMREALYAVSRDADRTRVVAALLTLCGVAPSSIAMPGVDRVQQLQWLRHEFRLTGDIVTGLLHFAQQAPPAQPVPASNDVASRAGVASLTPDPDTAPRRGDDASVAIAFTAWLDTMRAPGFFRCYFGSEAEAAAFIAGIASPGQPERERSLDDGSGAGLSEEGTRPRIWLQRDTGACSHIVILNESAWTAATRVHGPLPMASRIPGMPPDLSQASVRPHREAETSA